MDNRINAGFEIGAVGQIGVYCQIGGQLFLIDSYPPFTDGMNQFAIHLLFIAISKHELYIYNHFKFKSFYRITYHFTFLQKRLHILPEFGIEKAGKGFRTFNIFHKHTCFMIYTW